MMISDWVTRSAIARKKFSFADSPIPRMFSESADDVPRPVRKRGPERAEVVRHEEGRDRDREDVVEAQRPAGDERDELVERVSRERGGASGLRNHRGALGVGLRGEREQAARDHEDDRRQSERVGGDDPERVVDRRPDVPVRGREQATDADAAAQSVSLYARHVRTPTLGATASRKR
jgi:hypothetical protein